MADLCCGRHCISPNAGLIDVFVFLLGLSSQSVSNIWTVRWHCTRMCFTWRWWKERTRFSIVS